MPSPEAAVSSATPADHRPSLRRQLAILLAIAVAPAGILAVFQSVGTYRDALASSESAYMNDMILSSQRERDSFAGLRHALGALRASPAVGTFDQPDCDATLRNWVDATPAYALAVVVDEFGMTRCASTPDALGIDYSDSADWKEFMARPRFDIEAVARGRVTGERVIVAFTPLWRGAELAGNISVSIRTAFLEEMLSERVARGEAGRLAIVDETGATILRGGAEAASEPGLDWLPQPAELVPNLAGTPRIFRDGRGDVLAVAPLIDGRVWIIAGASAQEVYAGLLTRAAGQIAAPVAMWILAVGVAYVALDRLVLRHLTYLARLTRAYGRGKLSLRPRAAPGAPREIAILGEDLADMARRLESREAALREAAETKRALLLEVYHRVKNNLQMMVSLMRLQARRATDEVERATVERIQSRIHSLSLVHQTLYDTEDLHRVRLDMVLSEILAHAAQGREDLASPRLTLDPVTETAERATPAALFVNEAISEAMAEAERAGRSEGVELILRDNGGGAFCVSVAGPADRPDPRDPEALEVRLMAGYARQLRAKLRESTEGGQRLIVLEVPPPPEVRS